jgi:hypothetical protein
MSDWNRFQNQIDEQSKPDRSRLLSRTSSTVTLRFCLRDGKGEERKENGDYSVLISSRAGAHALLQFLRSNEKETLFVSSLFSLLLSCL